MCKDAILQRSHSTRTTTLKEMQYIHHHFFMCALNRCRAVTAPSELVVSEGFSRSIFDMVWFAMPMSKVYDMQRELCS